MISLLQKITTKDNILKGLLLLLSALFLVAGALPKFWDYWIITNISLAFAVHPVHFLDLLVARHHIQLVAFPPTFYAIQGGWLWIGSQLFHYDLTTGFNAWGSSYHQTSIGLFPFWGMVPVLVAFFLFVWIAYKELDNKWLTLLCFGPITFVSVIMYGQIDVVVVLFLYLSLVLLQRAFSCEKYLVVLLLSYLMLGVSMQFKTYGGLLLPVYAMYTVALVRVRKLDKLRSFELVGSCAIVFLIATFINWLPYAAWFSTIMLHGESNFLLKAPSPLFVVPAWLPGYVVILCYVMVRTLRNPSNVLSDRRYFAFDCFTVVAWFFIAVQTWPQWWMFIIPSALLVLDAFKSKIALVFCLIFLVAYSFYMTYWAAVTEGFAAYHIPVTLSHAQVWLPWAFQSVVGLLLIWLIILIIELANGKRQYL